MLEKTIENKLRKGIKAIGGLCLKFETPGYTGVPDRIILLPGGRVFFAETKAPGKKERARQEFVQRVLQRLGFTVFSTVDSEEKVQRILDVCRKEIMQVVVCQATLAEKATQITDDVTYIVDQGGRG